MSQLEKAFSWDENGNPVLVIYKLAPVTKTFSLNRQKVEGYVIDLNDIWMFSRDHYPAEVPCFFGFDAVGLPMTGYKTLTYDQAMFAKCEELCHQFELGVITSSKMADIASMIEEGIDELVSIRPKLPAEKHSIGEVEVTLKDKDGSIEKTIPI